MPISAFIFDMDGVIIDSTETHIEAWRQYLSLHGIVVDRLVDRMLGKHNQELVLKFFPDAQTFTADEIRAHGARKEALYRDMMRPIFMQKLVPGVADFIRQHSELPIGIATNAEYPNIDFTLEHSALRPSIRAIVNGDQVDRPKPAPDIYLRVAGLLGVASEACVVFEDSTTGVAAARAAGMRVVGLTTTLAQLPGVDLAIPDFYHPALASWLQQSSS